MDKDKSGIDEIIEALTILKNYGDPRFPFHCEHDTLYVMVDPEKVPEDDLKRLEVLGFRPSNLGGCFESSRYGSA